MRAARVILRDSVRQTDRLYSYLADEHVAEGSYVRVPFGKGNKQKEALVAEIYDECDEKVIPRLKQIAEPVEDRPVVPKDLLELLEPIASRFNCTRGQAVSLMVPSSVGKHRDRTALFADLTDRKTAEEVLESGILRSIAHINILEYLLANGKCEKKLLLTETKASAAQFKAVADKGLVKVTKEIDKSENISYEIPEISGKFQERYELSEAQTQAVESICSSSGYGVNLLYGITGSGKTEVYLNCAERVLAEGGNVIYMVPEISLTPQTINWILGRLNVPVAVLHSRLTDKQRYEQWKLIQNGTARVVVAPRSGVFAPMENVKLIIIDEEHDSSYKSESHPRYNAKDISLMRAKKTGAQVILGSATPSVESFYAAQKGYYKLLKLPKRARSDARLPKVFPVDMKEQIKLGMGEILSAPLRQAMARAFSANEQVMLFLNRRGFSRSLVCSECGLTANCKNCSVAMTLHYNKRLARNLLICHYCGYTIPADEFECAECGNKKFTKAGFGTQQLESLLGELYPNEKVLRMDQDTTMQTGAHRNIIDAFSAGEASILVGTQMIAKGHDFPNVTVVGILGADLMLASASCKASERAFQLITQAAGRAGRGGKPGEVYIQSYRPDLPLFKFAASQNYDAFYETEIAYREDMNLPPFKACGQIMLQLPTENNLEEKAQALFNYVKSFASYQDEKYGFEVYGPIPDVFYELRGRYRMDVVIKAKNKSAINAVFRQVMKDFDPAEYPLSYDNDYVS